MYILHQTEKVAQWALLLAILLMSSMALNMNRSVHLFHHLTICSSLVYFRNF